MLIGRHFYILLDVKMFGTSFNAGNVSAAKKTDFEYVKI
jgi:hypothetical protein